MTKQRLLRPVARWISVLMLAGVLCPRGGARAADSPAPAANGVPKANAVVLSTTGSDLVTLSAGERDGVTPGTEFRILRGTEEVARVSVIETTLATAKAKVISGLPASQLRSNDRAEMVGAPAPTPRKAGKFPWAVLVGAGIVALVVLGATRSKGSPTGSTGGSADVNVH